jgi:two-component system response regulator NreC
LLDINLLEQQGFEALRRLRRALDTIQFLLLTDSEASSLVSDALVAGASGCVFAQAADSTLVAAVRAVSQGYIYIQPDMLQAILRALHLQSTWSAEPGNDLTLREEEVLRLIAQGYTNRQAAEELGLTVQTVGSYREKIMSKLGLRSRAELVQYAAAWRLADLPN